MSTRRCITHHHACDCREARFAELERENARLTAELEDARRTCAELVTDGNAITLAQSLQRAAAENARLREDLRELLGYIREPLSAYVHGDIDLLPSQINQMLADVDTARNALNRRAPDVSP
jgi:hypothetical protein